MIYALQTARAGSKSVVNKNIMDIHGKPLFMHNADAAIGCNKIKDLYVSTDCEVIKSHRSNGYKIIDRPESMRGDNASHHDVMKHAVDHIEEATGEELKLLVILLGNAMGCTSGDLECAIHLLENNPEFDSVESVSEFNMFNPFRALHIVDGQLTTVVDQDIIREQATLKNINDKKSCGDTYFFNGSFWVCRRSAIMDAGGMLPFPWLGNKVAPYVQETCFELDAPWQVVCIQHQNR